MNALVRVLATLSMLCVLTSAKSQQGSPAVDQLAALCFYDIAVELCGFAVTGEQQKALKAERAKIKRNKGEEIEAAALCNSLKDDAKRGIASFCSPQMKAHFNQTLDRLRD